VQKDYLDDSCLTDCLVGNLVDNLDNLVDW